uniref:Uncharacterized protein n=1 Tax=Arundo donax TaxID=35708 RepID=A0A0A9E3X3_ARUDO
MRSNQKLWKRLGVRLIHLIQSRCLSK